MEYIFQVSVFDNYLKMKTNYALILYGNYGIGKTFFYKNVLTPKINVTSIIEDKDKVYKSIHISLFGLKTTEDIEVAILGELYPLMKENNLKLASGIGKSLLRGIFKLGQLGDIDKYIDDFSDVTVKQQVTERLSYNQLVICFDDLDRKHKNLDISELFGFINRLVENEGAKIIIIANEEILKKEAEYGEITEKVIGVKVQFEQDINLVINAIIDNNYKDNYYLFLKENLNVIISFLEVNNNNLRNLLYCFEQFKVIFDSMELFFKENEKYRIVQKNVYTAVFNFSMAILIELKIGNLTFDNTKYIIGGDFKFKRLLTKLKKTVEEDDSQIAMDYAQSFSDKYFKNLEYYRFISVYRSIVFAVTLNKDSFEKEILEYFNPLIEANKEEYEVFNRLRYYDCLDLNYRDYKKTTQQMLKYVDRGMYKLTEYPILFEYSIRFDNILEYDLNQLVERFKKGIKKGVSNYVGIEDYLWQVKFKSSNSEFPEESNEIIMFCSNLGEEIFISSNETEKLKLLNLFKSNFEEYLDIVSSKDSKWRTENYLDYFVAHDIYNILLRMKNSEVWAFINYLEHRIILINRNINNLGFEKSFYNELIKCINTKNKKISKMKSFLLLRMHNVLSDKML
ncbi:MAG: KAP family NTPase [Flavobacteriaceae bacterium]|jgi:hypothetical protein|nr:KAP family NTPase [Flavobacteriaceae bacterium]